MSDDQLALRKQLDYITETISALGIRCNVAALLAEQLNEDGAGITSDTTWFINEYRAIYEILIARLNRLESTLTPLLEIKSGVSVDD